MEKLIGILNDIDDSIQWEKEQGLIDRRLLDSFGVISLVSELEDSFSIEIEAGEMVPEILILWKLYTEWCRGFRRNRDVIP